MNTVDSVAKLALGTVQFGLPYGISNHQGQVVSDEVGLILENARSSGVQILDTAIAYGESEQVLGRHDLSSFSVVTKLPEMPKNCADIFQWVESELHDSLSRLGLPSVDGVLFHKPSQLMSPEGQELYLALQKQKEKGLLRRVGISVYGPDELDLLCKKYHFDLVQAPFNPIDQRLLSAGWLDRLEKTNTGLHIRSAFMQGLLLMSKAERPGKFSKWSDKWELWERWLSDMELTPLEACLRYALSMPQIESVVVGVDGLSQWKEILSAASGDCPSLPDGLSCTDVELLNPGLWGQL